MIRARIYGREVAMQGGPYSLLAYRREFDSDLIGDLLALEGVMATDAAAATEGMLRVAWAMCRTADEATPGYGEWLRSLDGEGFSLRADASPLGVIDSAVWAELFRDTAPPTARARLRRRLARSLGSLAQRLGA